jgi:hypothetical protein
MDRPVGHLLAMNFANTFKQRYECVDYFFFTELLFHMRTHPKTNLGLKGRLLLRIEQSLIERNSLEDMCLLKLRQSLVGRTGKVPINSSCGFVQEEDIVGLVFDESQRKGIQCLHLFLLNIFIHATYTYDHPNSISLLQPLSAFTNVKETPCLFLCFTRWL